MNTVSEEQPVAVETVSQDAALAKQKAFSEIKTNDRGAMVAMNLESKFRLARIYHASQIMPKGLNTPEKILVALEICSELGLPPMTSIGKIAVINGVPSLFGELPLALVMKSGLLVDIEEVPMFKDTGEQIGAQCTVQRKGMKPKVRIFSVDDAKKAALWGKPGPWSLYPSRMLQMRTRSWALKDLFPDVLMGIPIAEYDFNAVVHPDGRIEGAIDGTSAALEINNKYLGAKNEDKP